MTEQEDEHLLKNAREALASYREAENQARIDLADAIERKKRAKEKFEKVFQETEARAVARKRSKIL